MIAPSSSAASVLDMASPSEKKENYLLSYEGHWAAVRTTFTPRSLSEVPQVFYVCQSKILSCCENLSTDYICYQIDRFIVSKFPAGAWVRGNQHIFRSDVCSETNCLQKAQENFDSLHSELTETVRTKAKRKPKKRPRTEDDLNSTTSTSPPGRDGLPLHDDGISDKNDETDTDRTMATKIATKLLRGIAALRSGHVAPAYQRLSYDSQFIQITVEKKTADIGQLGVDLWRLSEETERKAVNTAWRDRLLSSCCRIYCNANNLRPPGTDPDPEREKTQKRHGDAIAMLCWVVNDLYKWRRSLALVLFPALCVMQYNLGTAPRVGVDRRRRIAALVASALRYEPIAVPTDLHVLHPAVFLACNCPGIQLKDICDSLGLNNLNLLSLSASETEEFALGVPIHLLLGRDGTDHLWSFPDKKNGLTLTSDSSPAREEATSAQISGKYDEGVSELSRREYAQPQASTLTSPKLRSSPSPRALNAKSPAVEEFPPRKDTTRPDLTTQSLQLVSRMTDRQEMGLETVLGPSVQSPGSWPLDDNHEDPRGQVNDALGGASIHDPGCYQRRDHRRDQVVTTGGWAFSNDEQQVNDLDQVIELDWLEDSRLIFS